MWSLLKSEAFDAIKLCTETPDSIKRTVITGVAAYPLLSEIVNKAKEKWQNLNCEVFAVKNDFFGHQITVAGLVTGSDIINQLKGKDIGKEILIPSVMLRFENDMFLDDVTVKELEKQLNVKVIITENDGYDLINKLLNIKEV